jgi:HD-GYP domain-containing protein (c-di-GMP phosphodiesterase class II)
VFSEGVGLLSLDAGSDQRLQGSQSVLLQSVRSILCAPISSAKEVYGVIYVDTHETLSESDEDDLDWLVAVAHQAGMVMEKLIALSQKQRMTESLMRALAASIDARDGLTAGHSARVAHYSVGIARTLDQPVSAQYAIYYAALLHDYGKIGIDDAVLKKPGRLTPDEFDHIKLHPKFTYDILSKIDFPPELAELPMMAASHHERWDGTGYPWGLKEEATPLAGRIIAVADVYDSLTRKRHYRDPMPLDEVLSYLEEGRASHFDPTCLDAFFAYHREELNAKERRRAEKRERSLADEPTGGLDASTQADQEAATGGEGLAETDPEGARAAGTDPGDDSYFGSSDEVDEVTVRVEGS